METKTKRALKESGELNEERTVSKMETVQEEGRKIEEMVHEPKKKTSDNHR